MNKKVSHAERRRLERQRKRVLNLAIIGGVSLIVIGFFAYLASRPVEIIEVASRSFPVPVDGLVIGEPDAPVLVEVYEDFQCPSCASFTENLEERILQNFVYNGTARFQFHNFAFIGQESLNASNAAMCANEQDRFWDFQAILFANQVGENQGAFSSRRIEAMAESLGLDMESWRACYDEQRYETAILDDVADGRSRGVTGTPTVFVEGVQVPADYQSISSAITLASGGQ